MADETKKVIGTHNGKFHADEVLGCYLLKQLPEYKSATITRSRDPDILNQCDVVIDVGGVYDHSRKRYDHHQKTFSETLESVAGVRHQDIKLSSAGLVWAHYGKDVLNAMAKNDLSSQAIDDAYCHMYDSFIKEVDAKDNGIDIANPPFRYRINTDFGNRISRLNPNAFLPELNEETQFMKAVELAEQEFLGILEYILRSWLPSKEIVRAALENRFSVDESGRIIKIEQHGVNWPSHLRALENDKKLTTLIYFVLFPDSQRGWRIQAVSRDGGFDLRQQVLPDCLALRNDELVAACGVEDAFFVHATGFIGGATSYEGVLKMAKLSLPDFDVNKSTDS